MDDTVDTQDEPDTVVTTDEFGGVTTHTSAKKMRGIRELQMLLAPDHACTGAGGITVHADGSESTYHRPCPGCVAQRKRVLGIDEVAQAEERAKRAAEAQSGFHWRDGWFFKRMDDGSVRLSVVVGSVIHQQVTIPAPEWASIVCSVSRDGETAERWNESQDFHGR